MAGAIDQGGRSEPERQGATPRASAAWAIPEIRVIKDEQGRLRIDQADPSTYGAYAARQFLATAEADPKYREGMTKRPSSPSIKITYVDDAGRPREAGVREIFCRMEGDALVLTAFEDAAGDTIKDLPIRAPALDEPDSDLDDADRFHELALAELGDVSLAPGPAVAEPEPEAARPGPIRQRRLPTGPLRQYDEEGASGPVAPPRTTASSPEPVAQPAPRGPAAASPVPTGIGGPVSPPPGLTVRALNEAEAAALRAMIEAKAGQVRWASGLLMQAAERHANDLRMQNEYLGNLLRVSLDPSRAESRTPLAAALRGILEEVRAYRAGVIGRDPLRAEKLALQPFARTALAPTPADDGPPKTVSGTAQKTPAQILAKLEDPKLARATRVKLLLEVVPELIEGWRPDKESDRSEAANENSPAVVRRLYTVANEQRQQRKFIDDGAAFRRANERYARLEPKVPKAADAGEE